MAKIYRYEFEQKPKIGINPGPYNLSSDIQPKYENIGGKLVDTPYGKLYNTMVGKHSDDNHLCVRRDIEGFENGIHFCACDSLESLKQWFKGFNSGLLRIGFKLVEYEVSKIVYGRTRLQVVFEKDHIISRKVLK